MMKILSILILTAFIFQSVIIYSQEIIPPNPDNETDIIPPDPDNETDIIPPDPDPDNETDIIPPTQDEIEEQLLQDRVSAIFDIEDNISNPYDCTDPAQTITFPYGSRLENCIVENGIFTSFPINCKRAEEVTYIRCHDNTINDLEGLQQFPNLEIFKISIMKGIGSKVKSLAPLRNLTRLKMLQLPSSEIDSIVFLTRLPNLYHLDLRDNHVTDLTYIRLMKTLNVLRLDRQAPIYISDITPLSKINGLQDLSIEGNHITDISPIATHINLSYLNFRDNRITSLDPLITLKNLYTINFEINLITNIITLGKLPRLGSISAGLNLVTDLSPLIELNNLIVADFRSNFISDVSPFTNMENILSIQLDRNIVTNIISIQDLKLSSHINELGFSYNCIPEEQIKDIKYLVDIQKVRFGKQCIFPNFDNVSYDLDNIVNKDIVLAHEEKVKNIELLLNDSGVSTGGCAIGSNNKTDIIYLFLAVIFINFIRRKVL